MVQGENGFVFSQQNQGVYRRWRQSIIGATLKRREGSGVMVLAVFEGIGSVCRGTIGAIAAVVEFIRKRVVSAAQGQSEQEALSYWAMRPDEFGNAQKCEKAMCFGCSLSRCTIPCAACAVMARCAELVL
jgi:hypothetical protein